MLSSCLIGAFSIIIFKGITNQYGFWTGIVYTFLGGGVLSILLLCIKRNRQEVLKVNFKKFIPFLLVNDTIDILGRLCYLYAMTLTLVALVEVLTSIQSLVVLFYGIILTLFFPKITKEDIRWKTIKNKIIVALIMFLGMWLVYF
jgi:drug/metabolite transporter (DMT)-like permease